MGMWKSLFAVLAGAAMVVSAPASAAEKWLKAQTRHFVIYSSGSRSQLEQFARKVEQFDALMRLLTRSPADDEPVVRLPIYVLGTAESVAELADDKSRGVAGFYRPWRYGTFAVANRERANSKFDLSADAVLFHEYAHHFMFHHFAFAYPAWYVEGFAEFVSTAEFFPDQTWSVGKTPLFRAYGLIAGQDLPLERILFGNTSGLSPAATDVYYGRSWLLVHMLRNDKLRANQLQDYLKALGAGVPEREAAKAFGDLKALDKQLDRYLDTKLTYARARSPLAYATDLAIAELDPVDSRLVALGLGRKAERNLVRTRKALGDLAARFPERGAVWLELAQTEYAIAGTSKETATQIAGRAAAEAAVDKALALDPQAGRAHLLKAELLMDRLERDDQRSASAWKPVRDHIARANRLDTDDPAPLFTWYASFLRQGFAPDQLASDGLAKAFLLAPEATDLRIQYAFDLARRKRFDEAIKLVEFVVRDPHNAGQGTEVIERLTKLRDAAEGGKESPADPAAPG